MAGSNLKKQSALLLALLCLSCVQVAAQKRTPSLEELPRIVIDTLDTPHKDVKIVLYTNNTWSYYYPNAEESFGRSVYQDHWVTSHVFAYTDIPLSSLPATIELELMSGLENYHPPIVGGIISKYGPRGSRNHNGVDIPLKIGEPIYATFDGKVRYSRYNSGGFGNLVILRHENGLETWYAHLSRRNVEVDDYVKAGTVIGFGGNTGRSKGPHLHFETRYCDQTFDPEHIIDFETGDVKYQTFVLEKSFFNIHSRASETLDEYEDFDKMLLASTPGQEVTSEDILKNIESAQNKAAVIRAQATDPLYHTIRSGENLTKIAKRYGTTISNLCKLNNITRDTPIKAGKKIRVR